MSEWHRVDMSKWETTANTRDTARATTETRQLIDQLVQHSIATAEAGEAREKQMLRWTRAGVVLAAIAAVASVVAIVVTVALN